MYEVICTRIYNGRIEVEAESAAAAMDYAKEHRGEIDWNFGEETIDYAEKII